MAIFYLIFAFLLNACAQVLFKTAALRGLRLESFRVLDLIAQNYLALLAAIALFLSAPFYLLALRQIPISVAYPAVVVMTFILVNSIAFFYLNEEINLMQVIGYLLIVMGLTLVMYFAKQVTG